MANSVSPYFPEFWAKTAQVLHKPKAIYRQLANFRAEAELKMGDTFHRILPTATAIQNYTRYTDIDMQDVVGTDESLVIDKQKAFGFQIDDMDEVQSNIALASTYAENAMRDMTNVMDSDFLYEAINATSLVDAGSVAGSSGSPISLSGSNIASVFAAVHESLANQNVELSNLYGVIDPNSFRVLMEQTGARETAMGDDVTRNGYSGNMIRYNGFDLYVTNNYTRSMLLALATTPTNGDTVTFTVGGVACLFTFVTTIGTTAGNVLIGGSADVARANLATLINAPGTTTANGVAFTGTALYALQSCVASNDNTANTLTFYAKGKSLSASETLTDATDSFTTAQSSKSLMFGRKGAIDGVVQIRPQIVMRDEPRGFVKNVLGKSLYTFKSFTDGSQQVVRVRLAV